MVNNVVIQGRCGADPVLKSTAAGKKYARVNIAYDRGTGQNKVTEWYSIFAWDKTAELIGKYFHKGDMILVTGHLQAGEYKAKDGTTRKSFDVVADRVDFTGDRRQRTDSSKSDPGKAFGWNEIIEDDGDLPFV